MGKKRKRGSSRSSGQSAAAVAAQPQGREGGTSSEAASASSPEPELSRSNLEPSIDGGAASRGRFAQLSYGAASARPSAVCSSRSDDDYVNETRRNDDGVVVSLEGTEKGGASGAVERIPPPLPRNCLHAAADGVDPDSMDLALVKETFVRMASKRNKSRRKEKKRKRSEDGDALSEEELLPTPIQLCAWPILLPPPSSWERARTPTNVIGIAPTGSGKTLCYGLPMMAHCQRWIEKQRIGVTGALRGASSVTKTFVYGLIMVPTRELALQVAKELKTVAKVLNKRLHCSLDEDTSAWTVEVMAIYGGVDKGDQLSSILRISEEGRWQHRRGGKAGGDDTSIERHAVNPRRVMIVSATPGRLLDLMRGGECGNASEGGLSSTEDRESAIDRAREMQCKAVANLLGLAEACIIDEADRMATNPEMSGQIDEILILLRKGCDQGSETTAPDIGGITARKENEGGCSWIPNGRQSVSLFSATFPHYVKTKFDGWVAPPRAFIKVGIVTLSGRQDNTDAANKNQEQKEAEKTSMAETRKEHSNLLSSRPQDGNSADSVVASNHAYDGHAKDSVEDVPPSTEVTSILRRKPASSEEKRECQQNRGGERGSLDVASIPSHVTQTLHVCSSHKKPRKLLNTLKKIRADEDSAGRSRHRGLLVVFFGQIKVLKYVAKLLKQEGIKCFEFHSQLSQTVRERAMNDFRSGKTPTMLATDIAARGIHVKGIEYVVNYDFPGSLEQYVHRCGRAGRGKQEKNATVYSFFTRELAPLAKDVIELLRSSDSWIDPNLRSLVGEDAATAEVRKKKKRRTKKRTTEDLPRKITKDENARMESKRSCDARLNLKEDDDDDDFDETGWDDKQFAHLSGNRIVLKRASHVSEAEDSDDERDSG